MTDLSHSQKVTVKVCSLTGRIVSEMVYEANAGIQERKLDDAVARLVPGLYVIEVIAEEGVCAIKTVR